MTPNVLYSPKTEGVGFSVDLSSDRRTDIEAKQSRVASMLRQTSQDGLLLMEPENIAWMTSGATPRGHIDPITYPIIFCTAESRWLISSNVDSQRMFEEELDSLGFQLKEWPWHWGREQFLGDLCANRKVLCDRPPGNGVDGEFLVAGSQFQKIRRVLSPYEQATLTALGQTISHALEATCRNFERNQTEREVAGQLAHRLMHRGVQPVHIGVAADGRSRLYRRFGFTTLPVEHYAVLVATGRKYGMNATASRTVCFNGPPEALKPELNAVVRVSASYLASTWPDAVPREVLNSGRRIYLLSGQEHEWLQSPQGFLTGRAAVEGMFTLESAEPLEPGWAITWMASAGAAQSCDTYLVTESGPKAVTPSEGWPMKRIRIQGADCVRPDVLIR